MKERVVRVLLLEGSPADARAVRKLLWEAQSGFFEVVWLDRLAAGLKHLEDTGAEVLLLDFSLADSAGFDTFTAVRNRASQVPVVVLAAEEEEKLALRALNEGAQEYLLKRQLSAPALERALRGDGVAALPRVHHEAHGLDRGVGGDVGRDRAGAGHALALGDQAGGGLALGGGDEVDSAQLVLAPPSAPVG